MERRLELMLALPQSGNACTFFCDAINYKRHRGNEPILHGVKVLDQLTARVVHCLT